MKRSELVEWSIANEGVATRSELVSLGVSAGTITTRIKDGEWQRPMPGVYLLFPGTPDLRQRLMCVQKWTKGTAVFSHMTAGYLHGICRQPPGVLDAYVAPTRGFRRTPRCRIRRSELSIVPVGDPPRTSLEQTVIDLINEASNESKALEILVSATQMNLDIASLRNSISGYKRMRHRMFVMRVTDLVDEGVESFLELKYHKRVERAHGLPRAVRQKRERIRGRWLRSDCWYEGLGVRVELDGELAHPGRATDADVMRDNDVRVALREITLRYRWPQVQNMPCTVAAQVAAALRRRGWGGTPTGCSPRCTAPREFAALLETAA